MQKKALKWVRIIIILLLVLLILCLIVANFKTAPFITNIEVTESKRFDNQVIFNVEVGNYFFKLDKTTWCLLTNSGQQPDSSDEGWIKAANGYCSFTIENGDYDVFVKDKYGNINNVKNQKVKINKVLEIKTNKDSLYMYKGMTENLKYELVTIGDVNDIVSWTSEDDKIASVDQNGLVKANDYGTTKIMVTTNSGIKKSVTVYVPDFITKPVINFNKNYVSCGQFNKEEANLIDQTLFDRINDAGYQTRAAVIEAARFLTLEFNYRIHYFSENGRLNNYEPYKHVDGEGRFYHKGLYLNEEKYAQLEAGASLVGPATWGCEIPMFVNLPQYTYGNKYPNGLDCSGFVTWVLLNAGFDVGDIGAGENPTQFDLDDLGTKVKISKELLESDRVKVGDLIGNNGHMAVLAGKDENNYYIAESLNTTAGVVMTTISKSKLLTSTLYKHIILMDDVYKKDGNYSEMWN